MCDFEEFIYTCNCSAIRLKSYCHQARNNRGHRCTRVKKLRNVWDLDYPCDKHKTAWAAGSGSGEPQVPDQGSSNSSGMPSAP